ncbi:hypothetical protein GF326_08065 [Candidatus Bathyarchaeota archaeon]|nr:hypothetical protein [Candidatus Bathyarchaeota archaeon]
MSLYNSALRKWKKFLPSNIGFYLHSSKITEYDSLNIYWDLAEDFCVEHNYSKTSKEIIFHTWYETFANAFYEILERENIVIEVKKEKINND